MANWWEYETPQQRFENALAKVNARDISLGRTPVGNMQRPSLPPVEPQTFPSFPGAETAMPPEPRYMTPLGGLPRLPDRPFEGYEQPEVSMSPAPGPLRIRVQRGTAETPYETKYVGGEKQEFVPGEGWRQIEDIPPEYGYGVTKEPYDPFKPVGEAIGKGIGKTLEVPAVRKGAEVLASETTQDILNAFMIAFPYGTLPAGGVSYAAMRTRDILRETGKVVPELERIATVIGQEVKYGSLPGFIGKRGAKRILTKAEAAFLNQRAKTEYWKAGMEADTPIVEILDRFKKPALPEGKLPKVEPPVVLKPLVGQAKQPWEMTREERYALKPDETFFYRIQPKGKSIDFDSKSSIDENVGGIFVFNTRPSEKYIKTEWQSNYYKNKELVVIKARVDDTVDVGDYEGEVLKKDKGIIVERISWDRTKSPKAWEPGWFADDRHYLEIRQALSEGKPVPPEVLKDYPELAKGIKPEVPPVAKGVEGKPTLPKVETKVPEIGQPPVEPPKEFGTAVTPDDRLKEVATFIHSKESLDLQNLTKSMKSAELAERLNVRQSIMEEQISHGVSVEEANKIANEALAGEFARPGTTLTDFMAKRWSEAGHNKIYEVLKDEPLEQISTITAFTNALAGKGIPRDVGTAGGSAYTRLSRIFPKEILDELEKKIPLKDIIERKLLGIPEEGMSDWAKSLKFPEHDWPYSQLYLKDMEELELSLQTVAPQQAGKGFPPHVMDTRTKLQRQIELERFRLDMKLVEGSITKERYELEIIDLQNKYTTFKQPPGPTEAELLAARVKFGGVRQPGLLGEEPLMFEQGTQNLIGEKPWIEGAPHLERRTSFQKQMDFLEWQRDYGGMTKDQYKLEVAILKHNERNIPYPSGIVEEIKVQKQPSLMPIGDQINWVKFLKEIGLTGLDIGNGLRTVKASFDNSFMRQMAKIMPSHPKESARGLLTSWKAVFNQKVADEAWQTMTRKPNYQIYEEIVAKYGSGDFVRPLYTKEGTPVWKMTEEYGFLSQERPVPRFLSKVPGIKHSNRGFITGCNEILFSLFEKRIELLKKKALKIASGEIKLAPGKAFNFEGELHDWMVMTSDMSARASLGAAKGSAKALGAAFFAPRKMWSDIIYPRHLFPLLQPNPMVRKEAWRTLSIYAGVTVGTALAGEQLGLWEVGKDRNSPNFLRIRIANTWLDPWGGGLDMVKLASRIATGSGTSATTGIRYDTTDVNSILHYLKGREHPAISTFTEVKTGKTYTGEDVNFKNVRQWLDRVGPMVLSDTVDAMAESGLGVVLGTLGPNIMGLGTQSYEQVPDKLKNKLAKDYDEFNKFPFMKELGIDLGNVPSDFRSIKYTPQQRADYQSIMGDKVIPGMRTFLASKPYLDKSSPEMQTEIIQSEMGRLKDVAREEFLNTLRITPTEAKENIRAREFLKARTITKEYYDMPKIVQREHPEVKTILEGIKKLEKSKYAIDIQHRQMLMESPLYQAYQREINRRQLNIRATKPEVEQALQYLNPGLIPISLRR